MIPPPEAEVCQLDGGLRLVIDRDATSVTWKCPYCSQISTETWETE